MRKTIEQVNEEKIFNRWLDKIDVDLILSWLENVEDEEKFKLEVGCCLYNEILRKTNFDQICRELKTKANIIFDEGQVVMTMFTCLMQIAMKEKNRKIAWLKERRKTVDSMVEMHRKTMELVLPDYERILKCTLLEEAKLSNC